MLPQSFEKTVGGSGEQQRTRLILLDGDITELVMSVSSFHQVFSLFQLKDRLKLFILLSF